MLRKLSASWLVVLVLLPFTAPFPAFDCTSSLNEVARQSGVTPTTAWAAGAEATPASLRPLAPTRALRLLARATLPSDRGFVQVLHGHTAESSVSRVVAHPARLSTILRV